MNQNTSSKKNEALPTKSDAKLILIAPPYLAGDKARSTLFPDASKTDTQTPNSPNSNLATPGFHDKQQQRFIFDLSDKEHHKFNTMMLSTDADIMLLIVDAVLGLEKRDYWSKLLGCLAAIPQIVLVIDNMAMVEWSKERFDALKTEFIEHTSDFVCKSLTAVPVDFRTKSQIHSLTGNAAWYDGPYLCEIISRLARTTLLTEAKTPLQSSDQFAAHIYWMSNEPMLPGRRYLLKMNSGFIDANISGLKHRINPETQEHQAAKRLHSGEIGYSNISLDKAISFSTFEDNRQNGRFQLIDKNSSEPVAICMIKHGLRRATNIRWQELIIHKSNRAKTMEQTPCILWFTGLSGSGKSTVASLIEQKLHLQGRFTYVLDGDNIRHGLCRDLGFTDADRVENLRRVSETAKLFVDAGMIVLASFISPFRSERQAARELFDEGEFVEIFVDTPLEVCEARDPKGLYKMARAGELKNFTGLDSSYEPPEDPEIVLHAGSTSTEVLANQVISELKARRLI